MMGLSSLARRTWLPLFILLLLSSAWAQETKDIYVTPRIEKELGLGDRYAVIIGIGKYKDKRIPTLNYTVTDAKAMYAILTDPRHGRFSKEKVRLLLDEGATGDAIKKGFTWLRRNVKAEDTVVVFYSGHGAPEEGNTYWVPFDADIDDLSATAVGNDFITGQLSQIQARRLITFLDSCYSAAIVEKKDKPKALFDQDFFARYKGEGRVTITASDGKELSLESKELGHGVFTYYLVEALRGKADKNQDGAVELEEVWEHVRQRVTDEAQRRGNRQRPNLIGQMTAGLLVSLNPGVLETEKARLEELKKLFLRKEITSAEYEEAEKVLRGEGEPRLLELVRRLAEGRLIAADYRLARAGALSGRAEERPTPKPPPEAKDEKVVALVERAKGQLGLKKFTTPKGDNAHETLMELLQLRPGHAEALRLLGQIAEGYKEWGEKAYREGRWQDARNWYERAKTVTPEDPIILSRLAEIEGKLAGAEERARLEAERRRREQEEALRREREERERKEKVAVGPPIPHETRGKDGASMVLIPTGGFKRGDWHGDGEANEKPPRLIYLDAYYIDQYLVTNEQFGRFVEASGHRTDAEKGGAGWVWTGAKWEHLSGAHWRAPTGPGSDLQNRRKHPVVQVSWNDAEAYCRWAGRRLPTEAEWEKAARGPEGWKYPWGNDWDPQRAIWWQNSGGRTHPVDRTYNTHRSPYGAVDMAGNAQQWVADWYSENYYAEAAERSPKGPASGTNRPTRGGSWDKNDPKFLRSAYRYWGTPDNRLSVLGFRCAMDAPSEVRLPGEGKGDLLALAKTRREQADRLREQREYARAQEAYQEAIRLNPSDADAHFGLGFALVELGKNQEGESAYREAIRLRPNFAVAHTNLGVALHRQGRNREAEAAYREAIRLGPGDAVPHRNLGNLLRGDGRYREAEVSLREALRIKPDYKEARDDLERLQQDLQGGLARAKVKREEGDRLREQREYARAQEAYQEAIRLNPSDADAHFGLGFALVELGRSQEGESAYREAIRLRPDFAVAHNNLGVALAMQGRNRDAESAYREAIRLRPEDFLAHRNLGTNLLDQGRYQEGERSLRQAIRYRPEDAKSHYNLGLALEKQGRREEARAAYREVLRLDPKHEEARKKVDELSRLEVDQELRRVEGVWTETKRGELKTSAGVPYSSQRIYTLTFRLEGRTVRGALEVREVASLPGQYQFNDSMTNELCGSVSSRQNRQYLDGTVEEGGVVRFTTKPGEIVQDSCSHLRRYGPDSLQSPGAYRGQLSPDGLSLSLDWTWSEWLGGGKMVLKKAR